MLLLERLPRLSISFFITIIGQGNAMMYVTCSGLGSPGGLYPVCPGCGIFSEVVLADRNAVWLIAPMGGRDEAACCIHCLAAPRFHFTMGGSAMSTASSGS